MDAVELTNCFDKDVGFFYPRVNLAEQKIEPPGPQDISSFLTVVDEPFLKRLLCTIAESGWQSALQELQRKVFATFPQIDRLYGLFAEIAAIIKTTLLPIQLSVAFTPECIAQYVEVKNWTNASICAIAWHPNWWGIAVAARDDYVLFFRGLTSNPQRQLLRYKEQTMITCLAWRPLCSVEIAVGCTKGICVWTSDHINGVHTVKPPKFLRSANHTPIISMQWDKYGTLLASTALNDNAVMLWHVEGERKQPLKTYGATFRFVKWSPDNSALFAARNGPAIRVWHTEKQYQAVNLTVKGNVQCACWSACSTYLYFVFENSSELNCLSPLPEDRYFQVECTQKIVTPLLDLNDFVCGELKAGGRPHAIQCCANGEFFAVLYRDTPYIGIFELKALQGDYVSFKPCTYIAGTAETYPCFICFQRNLRKPNCVLTVGWSDGRVEYRHIRIDLDKRCSMKILEPI